MRTISTAPSSYPNLSGVVPGFFTLYIVLHKPSGDPPSCKHGTTASPARIKATGSIRFEQSNFIRAVRLAEAKSKILWREWNTNPAGKSSDCASMHVMAEANYFTCTLGQAASANLQQPCKTVPELISFQAQRVPTSPAVGFAIPGSNPGDEWARSIFTFADIERKSRHVAVRLFDQYETQLSEHRTVGLLCPSTQEFLFTWLALIRLGHAVLLIAPQCQPAAIASLCKTCQVSCLLYDEEQREKAQGSARLSVEDGDWQHFAMSLPFAEKQERTALVPEDDTSGSAPLCSTWSSPVPSDVAYIHHTSGTSSGVPKPIPQSHRAAVGVLPSFVNGHESATFTTTPLYHGGVADLFRAWTSGALVWLFPGRRTPITASNIVRCLDVARQGEEAKEQSAVRYFSSVPYVLQSMAADSKGLQLLQDMHIVGVGGAALPTEVGDRLVESGVNLISRFGSAECGFLLSSHRNYTDDKAWQYLRDDPACSLLKFEPQADGTSELIVGKDWPHVAKRNRDDGGYATSDLFAQHEHIPDAWRYHSRADSQLTLITGKKFDPAPLEDAISTSALLDDVLIFGNGRQTPGALLIRSKVAADMSDTELLDKLWPSIERLNRESQDHARIPKNLIAPIAHLETPLEKSSKGTIIRRVAEARFSSLIEAVCDKLEQVEQKNVPDDELSRVIKETIEMTVAKGDRLQETTDLFSYGVDSITSMQIRQKLRSLLPADSSRLPINVVEDCGSVKALQDFILKRRHGELDSEERAAENIHQQMRELVERYSIFDAPTIDNEHTRSVEEKSNDVVVLTGATGALGAHILDQYRQQDNVVRIYCLVRGADQNAARERVTKAMTNRKLQRLADKSDNDKVVVIPAQLNDAHLGLELEMYERLAREATIIMHVAWSVNFKMRLLSFVKDNIAGIKNLINLALKSSSPLPPKFAFCSSVASVMAFQGDVVPEVIISDPTAATPLGYSQSKWIAEQICWAASKQTRLHGRVSVYRVGQLSGDTVHGIWNMKEAWPLMLSSVSRTGYLPVLHGESLSWLPVDVAASAMIEGVHHGANDGISIFHVVNEQHQPTWQDLLRWLAKSTQFIPVSTIEWIHKLEQLAESCPDHPVLQLLDHWKSAYGDAATTTTNEVTKCDRSNGAQSALQNPRFSMTQTKLHVPALRELTPLTETYVCKIWDWIKENTYE
nr:non-canonical non-ribosomal peptide synthetase fub8 [Quercus suber]